MMALSVFLEELYYRRIIAQNILNEKGFRKWLSALGFFVLVIFKHRFTKCFLAV
jgi:hypothetical protein